MLSVKAQMLHDCFSEASFIFTTVVVFDICLDLCAVVVYSLIDFYFLGYIWYFAEFVCWVVFGILRSLFVGSHLVSVIFWGS